MSSPVDPVVIEEIEIEKPSNTAWWILAAVIVAIAVVLGVRRARKGDAASADASSSEPLSS